jgi:hypothetical protein
VSAVINPAAHQFNLFRLEGFAAQWHARFAAFAQNAFQQQRSPAVARHEQRAAQSAFQRQRFHIQPQLPARFFRAVTGIARLLKDGFDVAREIHSRGLCLNGWPM